MMPHVTLYTKAGCGLCEDVKAALEALQATLPHTLTEVDIAQDAALYEQYRYVIPVVTVGSRQLTAPITAGQLKRALQAETI